MKKLNKTLLFATVLIGIGWWSLSNINTTKRADRINKRTAITTESEEDGENEEQKRINAEERWKAEFEMIKNPATGEIPKGIRQKEVKAALKATQFQLEATSTDKSLPTISITGKGPNNYGGRTRALGFDARNPNIVLAGGVTSGIYRSTDNGVNWTRVTPAGVIHSLSCLAQDPRVGFQDTWYAGTGEVGSSAGQNGAAYVGHGILKSTDNGLTWTALSSTQGGSLEVFDNKFDGVHRIVVDPANGNVLATALNSIQRSTDGGANWSNVLGNASNSLRSDLIYNSVSGKFYAAIDENEGSSTDSGIWSSTTGAANSWTQERTSTQISPVQYSGRIVLANVANTDDILAFFEYDGVVSCTNGSTTGVGLLHFDGTSTWTSHTDKIGNCSNSYTATTALPKQLEIQGGYNMALATKPNDADIVYLAGTEAYRYNLSTNAYEFIGGSQLAANAVNLHVDQHIFMFEPGSNDIMWAGNDGGLRKTDVTGSIAATTGNHNNGYTWTTRSNGYNGYQYYGVDIDPTDGSNFIAGGAQDNAFTIHPVDATALEIGPTADGVDIAVISGGSDFATHNMFLMWQNGSMVRFKDGNYTTGVVINPASTGFVGHFYLDADNTNYLYYPSNSKTLHRTRIAEAIASSSTTADATTGWESFTGVNSALTGDISAMDASRDIQYGNTDYSTSNANRKLYIGTTDGKVFRLDDPAFALASSTPVNITPSGSSGYVSDVAVNPLDDKEILVTYSSYGVNSVYHTSDASVASPVWVNVEGANGTAVQLASARSAMITVNNGVTVYMVGTSTGLYATDVLNGASTVWTRLGTTADIGLAVCVEMRLRTSDNKIVLGTHGNGAFLLEFPGNVALPVELASFDGRASEEGNILDWKTLSEKDNKGYDIQKSTDGIRFEKIGFVAGNGTTLDIQNYNFLDENINQGVAYYRLKQIDFNGDFEYSNIININNKGMNTKQVLLYPNPMRENLTIENGAGQISIYRISGELVRQLDVRETKQQIDVSDLSKGIYFIEIRKNDGTVTTQKIIK